ncbi:hypothetical protein ACXR0O_11540 [Verrucomicrobiota bacterium sgz303538]
MIQCADGEIDLQLDGKITPERVATFLNAVHQGYYSDGQLQCVPGALRFAPAGKLPSGEPVPAAEGRYEIIVSEQDAVAKSPNSLRARITKGGTVMRKLTESGEGENQPRSIPIQRVVRQN